MVERPEIDPSQAKAEIFAYARRRGALAVGVADLGAIERVAPAGHRPTDIMPRVKSVIAVGVGGQTQGTWRVPAKAMAYFGSTETRAYSCSYALAFFIESRFQVPSIYCPPDLDNEEGPRIPLQSLKLHAELAGLGARSLAGDILLHPEFGYMYYASVFTELELPPDEPLAENPCPAPSCVRDVPPPGTDPLHEVLPGAVPLGDDRRGGPAGGNALRHGRVRRDVAAVRGGSRDPRRGDGGRGRGAAPGHPLRPGPQDALVQDVGRLGRPPSPSASSACGSARSRPGRSWRIPSAAPGPRPGPGPGPEPTDDPGAHPGPARGDGRDGRRLRGDHLRAQQQPPDEAGRSGSGEGLRRDRGAPPRARHGRRRHRGPDRTHPGAGDPHPEPRGAAAVPHRPLPRAERARRRPALSRGTVRAVPGPLPVQRGGALPARRLFPGPGAGARLRRGGLVGLRHPLRLAPP